MTRRLMDHLRDAKVSFWMCPIADHAERKGVVTVKWDDDQVAHCTADGCMLTSESTRGTIQMAYAKGRDEVRVLWSETIPGHRWDPEGRICECGTLVGVACDDETVEEHLTAAAREALQRPRHGEEAQSDTRSKG